MSHDARERCIMVCPQCEGEGGYLDGVDEDACHTDCTRCGGNGWIVDLATLSPDPVLLGEVVERCAKVADEYAKRLSWDQKSRCTAEVIATAIRALAKLPKLTGEEV